jgi:hypothetical protein
MRRIGSGVVSMVILHFRYMTSLRLSLIMQALISFI